MILRKESGTSENTVSRFVELELGIEMDSKKSNRCEIIVGWCCDLFELHGSHDEMTQLE